MRGSIRTRGKRVEVRVYLGRRHNPESGKTTQQQLSKSFRTVREAEAYLARTLTQLDTGAFVPPTKVTLGSYIDEWLATYPTTKKLAPTTLAGYRTIAHTLKTHLGVIPLARLAPETIDRFYAEQLTTGLSGTTVHAYHRLLREVLGHAVRKGKLAKNVALLADVPTKAPYTARIWDEEQTKLFLGYAKRHSPYYALYLTAIHTGLRQGELLGLAWKNVDLAIGECSVTQSFYRLPGSTRDRRKGELLWKSPKTKLSRRTIPLSPTVMEALRTLRETQSTQRAGFGPEYHDYGLVFCQANGLPLHAGNVVKRDFHPLTKAAGLPRIRFHSLRHAYCAYLAKAGVSVKAAQELLGHSTPMTTLSVYSHVLPGMQADAVRRVEALLADVVGSGGQNGDLTDGARLENP